MVGGLYILEEGDCLDSARTKKIDAAEGGDTSKDANARNRKPIARLFPFKLMIKDHARGIENKQRENRCFTKHVERCKSTDDQGSWKVT